MHSLQRGYTKIGHEALELSASGFPEGTRTAIPYKVPIIYKTYLRDSLTNHFCVTRGAHAKKVQSLV